MLDYMAQTCAKDNEKWSFTELTPGPGKTANHCGGVPFRARRL